jgi:RES domain-containing protein
VFRSASVRYANRDDFLTGAGSKIAGARWNPPESFTTTYTSLSPETATAEALAHQRHFNLPVELALPRVLAAAQVVLQRMFDLTDTKIRKSLRVSRDALLMEDWRAANADGGEALTQAIGRLAWEAEWEGLLVPSAAHSRGVNLIVFPGNLAPPGSYLLIVNREQLPTHPAT